MQQPRRELCADATTTISDITINLLLCLPFSRICTHVPAILNSTYYSTMHRSNDAYIRSRVLEDVTHIFGSTADDDDESQS